MPTVKELYEVASGMPPKDKLRLASLLLNSVANEEPLDGRDTDDLTDGDLRSAARLSLAYAAELYQDEDELLAVESEHA